VGVHDDARFHHEGLVTRRRVSVLVALCSLGAASACAPDESSIGSVLPDEAGLVAAYFDGRSFERPSGVYRDANIDFERWELNDRIESRGHVARTASIRWTGQIWLPYAETYTIFFALRGRVRLWIEDALIVDDWADSWNPREPRGTVGGGGWRALRVEWDQIAGPMDARLSTQSASQAKAVVPASALHGR
jgi:PA14 domain-containing protein